ncbi:MAG: zinc ribbon domain-containing protein [Chromatocurvus sp.]
MYEYVCESCGELTEALRKISDPPLEVCPVCGESALRKKVSAAAFRLKGGGWYETDFKTGDKKKNLVADESKGGGADKPSDTSKTPASDSGSAGSKPSADKAKTGKAETGKGTTSGGSSSAA